MNTITRHFIHLYFLAEFEVLFYIYYIMPYEKTLIYNIFKIKKWTDQIPIQNITYLFNSQCDGYDHEFDEYNGKLIKKCFYFIYFINAVLGAIFIYDAVTIYRKYTGPTKRRSNSMLSSFGSSNNIVEIKKTDEQTSVSQEQKEEQFIVYYWKNSELLSEFGKTVQFIVIVGVFEYLFFTTIVNKYKIVNSKTLICKMIDELD